MTDSFTNKIGYCCINKQLNEQKQKITTNRGMIKKTFLLKGVAYCGELFYKNLLDLEKIIDWNESKGIKLFRFSSDIAPWASEYDWQDLPNISDCMEVCSRIGEKIKKYGHRITTHPGQFNVLVSPNEEVVERTIKDLSIHGDIMDFLGLPRSTYAKINIHCGGAYGDKPSAMARFCKNFSRLPDNVKTRLTVENDDKASMFSVKDLYEGIHSVIGIPIVFDFHHYKFNTGGQTERQALEMALSTWGDIAPAVHYSESKSEHENNDKVKPQAHSDLINDMPDDYGHDFDLVVEAKHKEQAILPFI